MKQPFAMKNMVARKRRKERLRGHKKTSSDFPSFRGFVRPSVPLVSYSFPVADLGLFLLVHPPEDIFQCTTF